jgi:hypothetical protein
MTGNRVEELEARVRELQATVDGLTDELLETKERLRVVEEEVDPDLDMDIIEGRPAAAPETQTNDPSGGSARSDGGTGTGNGTGTGPTDEADGAKGGEDEEGDTDSADDIIVA